ncbi:hypothetical protein F4818DRAFT_116826 [Hypoxylon cercidicola]|nr:hypothetical protein F4818DRAFT_116826 [Hypoxylon cercidicola]
MATNEERAGPDCHDTFPGRICPACSAFIRAISPTRPRPAIGIPIMYTHNQRMRGLDYYEQNNELEKLWVGDVSPLSELVGNSPSNCYTCHILAPLKDVSDFQHWRDTVVDGEKPNTLTFWSPESDTWTIYFGARNGLAQAVSFMVSRIVERKDVNTEHTRLDSRDHEVERARAAVDRIPENLLSTAGMQIVRKKWLSDCLQGHEHCRNRRENRDSTHSNQVPTRIIHVSDERNARLVETASIPTDDLRYLTLSHAWGFAKFLVLTIGNLNSFRKRIPLENADFNQTFREAVLLTALLGYSYIWIDSLRIIQDSPGGADWAAECPRMTAIYSHSDLNISATGYADARKGMLDMSRAALVPPYLKLADGHLARVIVKYEHKGDWPLDKRGWVLQENALQKARAPSTSRPVALHGSATRLQAPRSGPSGRTP